MDNGLTTIQNAPSRAPLLGWAFGAALVNQIPLEAIASRTRRLILKKAHAEIAEKHGVELTNDAKKVLADVSLAGLPFSGVAWLTSFRVPVVGRITRFAAVPIVIAETTQLFGRLLLFDTYCTDLHTGVSMPKATAEKLHSTISNTLEEVPQIVFKQAVAETKEALANNKEAVERKLREIAAKIPILSRFIAPDSFEFANAANGEAVNPDIIDGDDGVGGLTSALDDEDDIDVETSVRSDPEASQKVAEHRASARALIYKLLSGAQTRISDVRSNFETSLQDQFRAQWDKPQSKAKSAASPSSKKPAK